MRMYKKCMAVILIVISLVAGDVRGCCAAERKGTERTGKKAAVKVTKTDTGYFYDGPGKDKALIFYSRSGKRKASSLLKKVAEGGADCFLVKFSSGSAASGYSKAEQVMKEYPHKHWYLGGNFRGGVLAADYAAENSEKFEGLILLSSYSDRDLSDCNLKVLSLYNRDDSDKTKERIKTARLRMPDSYEEYRVEGERFAWYMNYGRNERQGTVMVSVGKGRKLAAEKILDMMGVYNRRRGMRILMLGNSLTYYNKMPKTLAKLTGAEVVAHTQGNTGLEAHLDPDTRMGRVTCKALEDEKWDYVILQGMSHGPVQARKTFMEDVSRLCDRVRANGASPVLYATWAYKKGHKKLKKMGVTYKQMSRIVSRTYHQIGRRNHVPVADVGKAFYKLSKKKNLYCDDKRHPNKEGSKLAAKLLAGVIKKSEKGR
jgi:Lysophospholipase L1 and related esterases